MSISTWTAEFSYQFAWNGVVGDESGPITNGNQVYWLAKENNRILHVNLSTSGDLRKFQCVEAQTRTSSSWGIEIRNSPTITVLNIIGVYIGSGNGTASTAIAVLKLNKLGLSRTNVALVGSWYHFVEVPETAICHASPTNCMT